MLCRKFPAVCGKTTTSCPPSIFTHDAAAVYGLVDTSIDSAAAVVIAVVVA